MKKNYLIALLVLSVLVIFGTLVYSFLNFKKQFERYILPEIKKFAKKETGQELIFKDVIISFSNLLQLKPSIKIKEISLGETLKTDEIILVIYLKSLFNNELKIKKILAKNMIIVLEENEKREIKIKNINFKKPKTKKPNQFLEKIKKLSIDEIVINNSSLSFYPYKAKDAINLFNTNFKIKNLKLDANKSLIGFYGLNSNIFGQKSTIKSNGEFGPFDFKQKYYPLNGVEEITIYLEELPKDIKKQIFTSDIVLGSNSYINQNAKLSGNLNTVLKGNGLININNVYLGKNPEYRLNLNTTLDHAFSFNPTKAILDLTIKTRTFKVKIKKQDFGDLILNVKYSTNLHNQFTEFNVVGSFTGLEIKDALNCFTKYRNILSGKFAINTFQLNSRGFNPNELFTNLNGKAVVTIQKGSLYILKSLTRYQNLIDQLFTNTEDFTQKLSGEFIDLKTNIVIKNKMMHLSDILINVPSVKIKADGFIKEQGIIDFYAELFIDKIKTSIPLILSGTIEKPKIKPDLAKIGATKTSDLLESIFELGIKSLNRKKTGKEAIPEVQDSQPSQASPITSTPELTKEEKQKQIIKSFLKLGIETLNKTKSTSINGQTISPSITP